MDGTVSYAVDLFVDAPIFGVCARDSAICTVPTNRRMKRRMPRRRRAGFVKRSDRQRPIMCLHAAL